MDSQCYIHAYSEYNNLTNDLLGAIQIRGKNLRWHYCTESDMTALKKIIRHWEGRVIQEGAMMCEYARHQLKTLSKLCMKEKAYDVHIWSYHLSSASPPPKRNIAVRQVFLEKKMFLEVHVKIGINV